MLIWHLDTLWSTRWTFSQRWMLLTPVRFFYQLTNEARRRGWDSSKSISRKKMWERFLCWILCWEPKHPLHSCQRFGPRRGDRRWREKNSRSNFHSWQIAEWSHLFSLHLTSWTFFVWQMGITAVHAFWSLHVTRSQNLEGKVANLFWSLVYFLCGIFWQQWPRCQCLAQASWVNAVWSSR